MFDLSNLDNAQVDHMLRDTRYRVLARFVDASGRTHEAGEEFLYYGAHLNLVDKRMKLRVEQNGARGEWVFEYGRGDGPRPGNLKSYFEEMAYVGVPPEARAKEREAEEERRDAERTPGPMPDAPGGGPFAELYAAALAGDLERAEAVYKSIDEGNTLGDYHTEKLGSWLIKAASAAGSSRSPGARWLARKAMDQWRFWAACSTSGGEGTARSREVRQIEGQLKGYL